MSKIKTPQDRLKEYKGRIDGIYAAFDELRNVQVEATNYYDAASINYRMGHAADELQKVSCELIGYKQALEDVRKHTRYQLNVLQTMRITRDADIEVRMIAKDIEKILTIPEEE